MIEASLLSINIREENIQFDGNCNENNVSVNLGHIISYNYKLPAVATPAWYPDKKSSLYAIPEHELCLFQVSFESVLTLRCD